MNRKAGFYAVIGGVVGAVLAMAVCSGLPLGAQSQKANFGAIACTELRVLDAAGRTRTLVGQDSNGGYVVVYNKDFATTGDGAAKMNINEFGAGELSAVSAGGMAQMRAGGEGGVVEILDRRGLIMMDFSEYGGRIVAGGRDNSGLAQMGVAKGGGWISVSGVGDSEAKAVMSVNEYGNGAVSTWDTNGYRLATLK